MNIFRSVAIASAVVVGMAGAASAAVITHDFDDANNGQHSYQKDGYTYTPMNFNSASSCYTAVVVGPGNGNCFLETTNGTPTDLTEDTGAAFDLLSFYFNFQGTAPNTLDLFADGVKTTTIALGTSYSGAGDFKIYKEDDFTTAFTGALKKQKGYFVLFNNDLFDGIKKFTWEAAENKQIRVDCVSIGTGGSNITASELGACAPTTPPNVVPLPAGAILMLTALGGLGFARKRKA